MQGFRYQILPLHTPFESLHGLLDQVYHLWEQTFSSVLQTAGAELNPDDFFRSDVAGVLLYHDEIVGFNLFTLFDLNLSPHRHHRYFRDLTTETLLHLQKNYKRLFTAEYFTLAPEWRKNSHHIPWSEILTGLALQFLDCSEAHAVVGTPRVDLRVDQMCQRLGATPLQSEIRKMNYPCAVVLFEKQELRTFHNPTTHFWVKQLWKNHLRELLPKALAPTSSSTAFSAVPEESTQDTDEPVS